MTFEHVPGRRARSWARLAPALLVAGLLVLHAGLLLGSLRRNFVTVDESGHIPSGLAHWQAGTFAPYRVNPPLPRLLAALPVLAARPDTDYPLPPEAPGLRQEWPLAKSFAEHNAARYFDLVCLARLPGLFWSLLGGLVVYRWAGELYGPAAGILGLALWCLEPNILANAQLVTADIPAAATGLAASYLFWHYLKEPTWARAWFTGIVLGLALLCKVTLVVLCGLWPLLAILYWWGKNLGRRLVLLGQLVLLFVLGVVVLNSGYGFADTCRPLGEFTFVSKAFTGGPSEGNRFQGTWLGNVPLPVPANYLLGLDVQRRDFESGWPFYLGGQWQIGGWWYFYLYALALKLPLGILALAAGAVALGVRRREPDAPARVEETLAGASGSQQTATTGRDELALLLPALALLVLVSSQTGIQHFRYLLPALPFLLIFASRCAAVCHPRRLLISAAVVGMVLWTGFSCLAVYPHTLSYFNEAAGGPAGGPDYLVDSNVDWGQDLLFLQEWLKAHPEARPLGLAYFNCVDPAVLGIEYHLPPPLYGEDKTRALQARPTFDLRPGYYAVSAHLLRGGSFLVPNGKGQWVMVPLHGYEYFQRFRPIARAGYSIQIFRITAAQASAASKSLSGPAGASPAGP